MISLLLRKTCCCCPGPVVGEVPLGGVAGGAGADRRETGAAQAPRAPVGKIMLAAAVEPRVHRDPALEHSKCSPRKSTSFRRGKTIFLTLDIQGPALVRRPRCEQQRARTKSRKGKRPEELRKRPGCSQPGMEKAIDTAPPVKYLPRSDTTLFRRAL